MWEDTDGDGFSSCEEVGSMAPRMGLIGVQDRYYGFDLMGEKSLITRAAGPTTDLSLTDPVPSCLVERFRGRNWRNSTAAGYQLLVLPYLTYQGTWTFASTENVFDHDYLILHNGSNYKSFVANYFYYDCTGYKRRYGVPYVIRAGNLLASNGKEVMTPNQMTSVTSFEISATRQLISGDPAAPNMYTDMYEQSGGIKYPERHQAAYCERVGPAPALPPSDPGDPGAYPMAQDGSGYCLSPGRKLPTYRDGSGTPTSSASDSVVELATEAVDDPANCPG